MENAPKRNSGVPMKIFIITKCGYFYMLKTRTIDTS